MRKKFNKYLWIIVGLFFAVFLFQQIYWSPDFSFLKSKPVNIDETPILIKEIKSLSQLIAITSYDETCMDSSKEKNLPSFPGLRPDPDKIVIIAKGKVSAGMDLKKIEQKDVIFKNDTLRIQLPHAEILSIIVNPSDFETFDEKGNWSDEQVKDIKIRIRNKILQRAVAAGILSKANERCKLLMQNFLNSLGYKKMVISTL